MTYQDDCHHDWAETTNQEHITCMRCGKTMTNPYHLGESMKRVIEHEANQNHDGGFFAKLYGLDTEPDDDGPTAKGLFQHVDFEQPGTPVYAATNETYRHRNQPDYFYHGEPRSDGTHDVYRVPFKYIAKMQLPLDDYVGNFTTEQLKNGEHRK